MKLQEAYDILSSLVGDIIKERQLKLLGHVLRRENENDPEHGKIRKLSVTCSLTDPKKYKGGELEFNFNRPNQKKKYNIKKCIEILPKGSIVVFPSFVWHRVCPVTKGTRNSLVIWNIGWPFK